MHGAVQVLVVTKVEKEILDALNGYTTLQALIEATGKSDKYIRLILGELVARGLVEKAPPVASTWRATKAVTGE